MAIQSGPGYQTASVRELMRADGWAPIRRSLGIDSFGVNAWTAEEVGGELILEHVEISHEELYIVMQGRATFTLDGEEIDAPAGALVLVSDPAVLRGAVAAEAHTLVLSIGAEPGVAFQPGFWETNRDVLPLFAERRYAEAKTILLDGLEEYADHSGLLFNLACADSRMGDLDGALDYLRQAVDARSELAALAAEDPDLEPLRADPRFAEIAAGARASELPAR